LLLIGLRLHIREFAALYERMIVSAGIGEGRKSAKVLFVNGRPRASRPDLRQIWPGRLSTTASSPSLQLAPREGEHALPSLLGEGLGEGLQC